MRRLATLLPIVLSPFLLLTAAADDGGDRGVGVSSQPRRGAIVYAVDGFDAVSLGSGAQVAVRVGPAWSVQATGPATAFANLRIARVGRSLEIGRRYRDRHADAAIERQLRVVVTMPRIAGAAVGGSGRMLVDRAVGERFEAAVGGSGDLMVGALAVQAARLSVGGSGHVAARGRVERLTVSVGGSGRVDAPALHAAHADVSLGGSGSIRVDVAGPAQVSMAGSGEIDLGAGARCTTSKVGSGHVRCGG